jgi:hypothetical protein
MVQDHISEGDFVLVKVEEGEQQSEEPGRGECITDLDFEMNDEEEEQLLRREPQLQQQLAMALEVHADLVVQPQQHQQLQLEGDQHSSFVRFVFISSLLTKTQHKYEWTVTLNKIKMNNNVCLGSVPVLMSVFLFKY